MMKLDPTTEPTEVYCLQWTPQIIPGERNKRKFAKEISQKNAEMKTAENQPNSVVVTNMSITPKSVLYFSLVSLDMRNFLFSTLKRIALILVHT